jgi:Uma2 family endonuclease
MSIALETNLNNNPNTLSLEEFLALPETKPASEYRNGEIYQKPMPQGKHSTLQSEIVTLINQRAKSEKIAYAFPELRCNFAGRSMVPDIVVFEWERIPVDEDGEIMNRITIAPDWIIEILSPDQSPLEVIDKISFAIKNGTKLGWLISPKEKKVLVFQGDRLPETMSGDLPLPILDIFPDWQLTVADLLSLLTFTSKK